MKKLTKQNFNFIVRMLLFGAILLMIMRIGQRILLPKNGQNENFTPVTDRLGVWWWQTDNLDDWSYLDFARDNGVTEIYLNQHHLSIVNPSGTFGPYGVETVVMPTQNFIQAASERGIDVYLLLSNTGTWLIDDARFHQIMKGFFAYQQLANDNQQFSGIHFNIEPNQMTMTDGSRYWDLGHEKQQELMQKLINFAVAATDKYGSYTTFDWATGFWWQNFYVNYRDTTIPLHHALIIEAQTTYVMSFRNTACRMVNVAQDHLEFANRIGQPIFLGANIISNSASENEQFYQLGRNYFHQQMQQLLACAAEHEFHLVIHDITRWRHWRR